MIRAAVVPGRWVGVVIADDLHLVATRSRACGRKVAAAWDVTVDDIRAEVNQLVGELVEADEVVVEDSRTNELGQDIATSLARRLGEAGVTVRLVREWRAGRLNVHGAYARERLRETGWPAGQFAIQRDAQCLYLDTFFPRKEAVTDDARTDEAAKQADSTHEGRTGGDRGGAGVRAIAVDDAPAGSREIESTFGSVRTTREGGNINDERRESGNRGGEAVGTSDGRHAANSPVMAVRVGTSDGGRAVDPSVAARRDDDRTDPRAIARDVVRVAGIVPTSTRVAVFVGDRYVSADAPDRWGLVARDARVFDVGEYVPLPKPRKLTRADGSVVQITTRHSLTTAMIDRVRDEVFDFVRESGVGAVAIERVESVFLREGAAGSAVASAILKAGYVCEAIRQKLDVQGFHVVPVRAAAWRAALGKSWHDRIDGTVVLPGAEAAGCALWLVEPPPPPRTPRVRRAPSETRDALRKRRTQAEREATGCTCDGRGRHKRACPLAKQGAKFGRKKGGKNAKTPEISLEKSS